MSSDSFPHVFLSSARIQENQDGRPCTTENRTQDAHFILQFLEAREKRAKGRAVRLVNAVL
jgi:hypothetical protein